jgi:hypothetical protein
LKLSKGQRARLNKKAGIAANSEPWRLHCHATEKPRRMGPGTLFGFQGGKISTFKAVQEAASIL